MTHPQEIDNYIYGTIVPQYAEFDAAHREDHAHAVINQAMALLDAMPGWIEGQRKAESQQNTERQPDIVGQPGTTLQTNITQWLVPVDREILKMAAACHDLGLINGRERHHLDSGEIIRNDANLHRWFSEEDIETIAQGIRRKRASKHLRQTRCRSRPAHRRRNHHQTHNPVRVQALPGSRTRGSHCPCNRSPQRKIRPRRISQALDSLERKCQGAAGTAKHNR